MNINFQSLTLFKVEASGSEPPLDIYETEDSLIIDIDLPGIEPEKVLIKIIDDILIIEGIRIREIKEGVRFLCMERAREAFRKIVKLPVDIEAKDGRAVYNNGVVSLRFPKIRPEVVKIKITKE
ncbi:MAG: Hsp20/alpha crystallin family protein [Thermodesulfovibrionales bacterium]